MNKTLTQLGRQLLGIWQQLGVNQRVSMIVATVAVIGGMIGIAAYSSRTEYSLLYGRLDEAEAAKVIAALDESKVPYKISQGGGAIMVPADKVYQVRMQMASKGIPRGEGVGFEIFDKANFGISDFVQHANYNRAIEGELARTISQLDDVESSRVMIVAPENRLLNDASRKPTASVFVKVKGNGPLTPSAVNSIRLLVANSVEGLQANNVSVVDNQGNVLSENQEEDSPSGLSNSQLTARRNLEQYLTKKAEGMLDKVLGPGQAIVRVAADINWDTVTKTEEKYDPDGQVVKTSTINEENSDSATASPVAATPGVAANGNSDGQTNAPATPVNNTKTTKSIKTLGYELSKSTSSLIQAAGGIKRISSAVFIAQKFEGTGADRKAVPRAPEELQRIKHIVQSALGIMENDPARKDELTLEEIAFNEQPEIEMTQKFEKQEKREFWTGMGEKIIYPVLALGMIFMFWRTFKTTKFEEIPLGVPVGEPKGMSNGKSGSLAGYGRQRDGTPGVVTVDVLNQLIRENPSNVSSAVRTWLSTGKPNN